VSPPALQGPSAAGAALAQSHPHGEAEAQSLPRDALCWQGQTAFPRRQEGTQGMGYV